MEFIKKTIGKSGYLQALRRYKNQNTDAGMRSAVHNETSFSAKMVLLFALILLGVPARRKNLESFVKNLKGKDSTKMGQVPVAPVSGQAHFQSPFNQ